ncbi:MAG: MarR family transcriptional regulator [Bacteroidota bacterium]
MGLEEDIQQTKFKDEYSKAVINLVFTNNWLTERQNKIFKPHGLTVAQFNVLRILRGQHPKAVTVNLIIERMLDRMSNASRIVDKLEKKGLVIRRQCQTDRRAVDVQISDDGLALLSELDQTLENWNENAKNLSEEECKVLNDLLDKFRG